MLSHPQEDNWIIGMICYLVLAYKKEKKNLLEVP